MMESTDVKSMSLFRLTWPLLLTYALNLMMPVVDSLFLSRISDVAAGAVGALFPVLMIFNHFRWRQGAWQTIRVNE